jgi:hypothetical protein
MKKIKKYVKKREKKVYTEERPPTASLFWFGIKQVAAQKGKRNLLFDDT